MFRTAPVQQESPSTQQTKPQPKGTAQLEDATPNVESVQTTKTDANGVVPDNVTTPESPLDKFKTLWENDPNAKAPAEFIPEQLDPTKLQEVMGKVDLTKSITPENLAAIQDGGEGATAALLATLNTVAQQSMVQSTMVANKMMEQQISKALESMESKIPALLKEQNLANSLQEQNPIYSNPAVKPVIDAVKSQLSTKYPNATTSELTTMAQDFVKAMNVGLTPPAPSDTSETADNIDWSSFVSAPQ